MSMTEEDVLFLENVIKKIDLLFIPEIFVSSLEVYKIDGSVETIDPEDFDDILNSEESIQEQGIYRLGYTLDFFLIREIVEEETKSLLKSILG